MKNFIKFLKTDIKIINSYFLLAVILIILISIGYSSYALFSFTKTSSNVIEGKVGKINYTTNFSYTGECTTYIAKSDGYYNLEVWGAQGGNYNTTYVGGLGGYSKGIVYLTKGTTLYVCVGGQPQTVTTTKTAVPGGFNGGGNGFNRDYNSTYTYGQAGGGATDIRIGQNNLYARVIVAGGGSGSNNRISGYAGGGLSGVTGQSGYAGTQTSAGTGGSFGQGGSASTSGNNYKYGASGGGGGFYGGGAIASYSDSTNYDKYTGGGSGYVYTSSTASSYPSGCLLNSNNYLLKASTTQAINTGNGKATITYIGKNNPIGADTLIALTNNQNESGLYTITHSADSTLQIGATESVTEYRYRGASPKNYVTFNNEVWRIIGVFPTEDGTGNIENRIKLIKDQSIGNKYWNTTQVASTSSYNNWTGATLKTYLNTTYYNALSNIVEQSMIGNAKYYLGGYTQSTGISKEMMYQYERKISGSNTYYYGTNPNSWVGKLGLMYISDYGYAASDTCTSDLSNYNYETCTSNNWLYNIKKNEWLLPQRSNYSSDVFNIDADGLVGFNSVSNNYAVRPALYLKSNVQILDGDGTRSNPYTFTLNKNEDNSNANKPVLASNMIPVYYDETNSVWKKADTSNKTMENRWYNYDNHIWANAVTVTKINRATYLNASPGTTISMDDITTMWVWIPRFNAVTPSNYNGGTKNNPGAIDVTFVKQNETAIDAFTFGDKQLSGFWYGKFEMGHATLASSKTANNLGCTNETCSNANGIIIKPNVSSLRNQTVSSFFFASRSMEQTGNSFGFVSTEVDTHMSKNNEWGAVAYLTQSIYGRCVSSIACIEVGINNNSGYITGIGAAPGTGNTTSTSNSYDTVLGMGASTTSNIYGIYDMNGGAWEYVMGVYNKTISSSGFASLPNEKYYDNYTATYQGHALTETAYWYSDNASFVNLNLPWFRRGGCHSDGMKAGVFNFDDVNGGSSPYASSHFVITNE